MVIVTLLRAIMIVLLKHEANYVKYFKVAVYATIIL